MAATKSIVATTRMEDIADQQFNKWTVLCKVPHPSGRTYWLCRCECGTEKSVREDGIRNGNSRQCNHCKNRRHGMEGSSEYGIWSNMLQRCNNPSAQAYGRYGGRGIKVCDRWHDFALFYEDMGPRPSPKHSIDRYPNNNGNYEPGNCRWATKNEQQRNMRSNRLLTLDGKTRCLAEWAELVGLGWTTLDKRLRRGMSVEDALTTPVAHEYSHPRN